VPFSDDDTLAPGRQVMFHSPVEGEDEIGRPLEVVEDRGDRVLITDTEEAQRNPLAGQRVVPKSDLTDFALRRENVQYIKPSEYVHPHSRR
jgi:hypothetical protein